MVDRLCVLGCHPGPVENLKQEFEQKIEYLERAEDGESGEESHQAAHKAQRPNQGDLGVVGDLGHRGSVEVHLDHLESRLHVVLALVAEVAVALSRHNPVVAIVRAYRLLVGSILDVS